ncbi:hypothetical protein DRO59_00850 [Candidatus Bathyarchaeota archaeon]|nr:MAG: hypothetical protein DRO59_00850 [Candidatus Bathyarchaeota archaeon]
MERQEYLIRKRDGREFKVIIESEPEPTMEPDLADLIEEALEEKASKSGWPLGPTQKIRLRNKTKRFMRLQYIQSFGIWGALEVLNMKAEKEPEGKLNIDTKDPLGKLIAEALKGKKRGRPRKKEESRVLPGTRIGDMYAKWGEFHCDWKDKPDSEVDVGTMEVIESLLYGNE